MVSSTVSFSMKLSIFPSESQVMSTIVESRVGISSSRCSGAMGKSWSMAQWSGALWKTEKLAMYWSARRSSSPRVWPGMRLRRLLIPTSLRHSLQNSPSMAARSSSPRMPSLNIVSACSFFATASLYVSPEFFEVSPATISRISRTIAVSGASGTGTGSPSASSAPFSPNSMWPNTFIRMHE